MYMDIVLASLHVHLETSSDIPGIWIPKKPSHLARLLVIGRYQLRQNICQTEPWRFKKGGKNVPQRTAQKQTAKANSNRGNGNGNGSIPCDDRTTECLAAQRCSSLIWRTVPKGRLILGFQPFQGRGVKRCGRQKRPSLQLFNNQKKKKIYIYIYIYI